MTRRVIAKPGKSLHKLNQILDEFKSGDRDRAEFWIDLKDSKIYIRYSAVRDEEGKYLVVSRQHRILRKFRR